VTSGVHCQAWISNNMVNAPVPLPKGLNPAMPRVSHSPVKAPPTGASSSFQATPTDTGGVTIGSSNTVPSRPNRPPLASSATAAATPAPTLSAVPSTANTTERNSDPPKATDSAAATKLSKPTNARSGRASDERVNASAIPTTVG
jgi:hypothetical protein